MKNFKEPHYLSIGENSQKLKLKVTPIEKINIQTKTDLLIDRIKEQSEFNYKKSIDSRRYRPEISLSRSEPNLIIENFMCGSESIILIDGPSGAGKTTLMCDITQKRMTESKLVYLNLANGEARTKYPDSIGSEINYSGNINDMFSVIADISADSKVLVLIDDLGIAQDEKTSLETLFEWSELIKKTDLKIKIVVTINSDKICLHENDIPPFSLRYSLPPFSTEELIEISDRISVTLKTYDSTINKLRKELACRLCTFDSTTVRRPSLAVKLLEQIELSNTNTNYSAYSIYSEIWKRDVLSVSNKNGIAQTPLRAKILLNIVSVMLNRNTLTLRLDDEDLQLIIPECGKRVAIYEELLSSQILIESIDGFFPCISFEDTRFFEFVASISLITNSFNIIEVLNKSVNFHPALNIVAFYFISQISNPQKFFTQIKNLNIDYIEKIFKAIAIFDFNSFILCLPILGNEYSINFVNIISWLCDSGEPRLASIACSKLIELLNNENDIASLRYINARAYFEIDEYDRAEAELKIIKDLMPIKVYSLLGDVEISKENYTEAKHAYETALNLSGNSNEIIVFHSLRGLGYSLWKLNFIAEAEVFLNKAIKKLELYTPCKQLAEAWSDYGELIMDKGDFNQARDCFQKSMDINKKTLNIVGIGIIEGILGKLDRIEKKHTSSRSRLLKSFEIANRTSNKWRQNWCEKELALLDAQESEKVNGDD